MDKIKCIIVEDEIPAAEELNYIISKNDNILVNRIVHDGKSAVEIVKNEGPDAVFLDINIPGRTGTEVADIIKNFNDSIDIIFVTAYEKYALKAFKLYALDYVLKPFDEERIKITIDRLIDKRSKKNMESEKIPYMLNKLIDKIDKDKKILKKIPCESNGKTILVDASDIYYCYIEEDRTYVKTRKEKYIVMSNLYQLQEKTSFFRCHRSYLVNMDNVKEFYSWFNGTYKLVMDDEKKSEIPISRNNVKKLKEYFGF
ncbi:sensory transduction protein LytT [Clostridium pasteurianum DSM 525 = ATCC 6013]|uniref:Stage 0 sporulation protein A homolog n=1 Tax=Clostridium pasteurianum DSM 525 = ATCC 6013 TaxID=1262449 RepID=A0A0H3J6T0_CLOPA|nr:LytTR family DNA-binding domain-containing protein [Clostridium pasteurianum]AJA48932.1 sensory transduction protein LytT [Clostridium pasteurianum DSM 525 = ATCC 6013]AJA52920.1 sensory transduction protein LytT [Clostridium pasteurianum DSM 525 = ATCC 6013]AOZ76141.1 two-component system response regulator [Clostridium pasteurianum DSM 525 = ATCC 6013]AOZ79937.1 two-component system response regulator [Clostridium pasteurianum]ELP60228.1 LytR/AlgR family response regulator [Clostridium pa